VRAWKEVKVSTASWVGGEWSCICGQSASMRAWAVREGGGPGEVVPEVFGGEGRVGVEEEVGGVEDVDEDAAGGEDFGGVSSAGAFVEAGFWIFRCTSLRTGPIGIRRSWGERMDVCLCVRGFLLELEGRVTKKTH